MCIIYLLYLPDQYLSTSDYQFVCNLKSESVPSDNE